MLLLLVATTWPCLPRFADCFLVVPTAADWGEIILVVVVLDKLEVDDAIDDDEVDDEVNVVVDVDVEVDVVEVDDDELGEVTVELKEEAAAVLGVLFFFPSMSINHSQPRCSKTWPM